MGEERIGELVVSSSQFLPKPLFYFANLSAGNWTSSAAEARLARNIAQSGAKVVLVNCDGHYTGICPVREARKRTLAELRSKQELDCGDCKFSAKLMSSPVNHPDLEHVWLGRELTSEELEQADKLAREAVDSGSPEKFTFRGYQLGNAASHDVVLRHKNPSLKLTELQKQEIQEGIKDLLVTLFSVEKLLGQVSRQASLIVRHPQYSRNYVLAKAFEKAGHRVLFLGSSANLKDSHSYVQMWDWTKYRNEHPALSKFSSQTHQVAQTGWSERVRAHFEILNKARSHQVYSRRKSRASRLSKEGLGLDPELPVVLAAMSSTDEMVASQLVETWPNLDYPGDVFADQVEWIEALCEWASIFEGVQVIVRPHPREFPTHRSQARSPMADKWENLLSELPGNVLIDLPSASRSIYDLFEVVDVVTTGWSSVAVEAASIGLPVVTYDSKLLGYPSELGLSGRNREQYFSNIEFALDGGLIKSEIRSVATKWVQFWMMRGTVKIGGRIFSNARTALPRPAQIVLEGLDRFGYFVMRPMDILLTRRVKNEFSRLKPVLFDGVASLYESDL